MRGKGPGGMILVTTVHATRDQKPAPNSLMCVDAGASTQTGGVALPPTRHLHRGRAPQVCASGRHAQKHSLSCTT